MARASDRQRRITLIDLGAGNCAKATRLFPLLEPQRYVAVDISVEFLRDALRRVQREHPQTDDRRPRPRLLERGWICRPSCSTAAPVFFYPGSSIGNFTPDEALGFLRQVRAQADGGGLLIGVDLVKDRATCSRRAYDDALGVTAAFNLQPAAPPEPA